MFSTKIIQQNQSKWPSKCCIYKKLLIHHASKWKTFFEHSVLLKVPRERENIISCWDTKIVKFMYFSDIFYNLLGSKVQGWKSIVWELNSSWKKIFLKPLPQDLHPKFISLIYFQPCCLNHTQRGVKEALVSCLFIIIYTWL